LFEAVLAGLGQFGIITRAVVDLVPARALARVFQLSYTDNATFFHDFRKLIDRGEFDGAFNAWLPNGQGGFFYQLNAIKYFDPASPPDNDHLLRGLRVDPAAITVVTPDPPYLAQVEQIDFLIAFFRQLGLFDGVQHPWFDAFLPESQVERYVGEV